MLDFIDCNVGSRVEFQYVTSLVLITQTYCQPKILLGARRLGATIISTSANYTITLIKVDTEDAGSI